MRVSGKVALVTGAAQGLGAAIADRLEEEGARVFRTDIKQTPIVQDVSSVEAWDKIVQQIRTDAGKLHILVNNAAIEGAIDAPKDPEHAPVEDWDNIFRVNARGVFLGCRAAIPLMAQSGGAIINMSSVASLVPTPFITAYGAAKASVEHLSRTVALHCAQSGYAIRCNSVHPGQVLTPMLKNLLARWADERGVTAAEVADGFRETIPMKAFQEPLDIANIVLFLASDEARYLTGQAIAVDGGFTLVN